MFDVSVCSSFCFLLFSGFFFLVIYAAAAGLKLDLNEFWF